MVCEEEGEEGRRDLGDEIAHGEREGWVDWLRVGGGLGHGEGGWRWW